MRSGRRAAGAASAAAVVAALLVPTGLAPVGVAAARAAVATDGPSSADASADATGTGVLGNGLSRLLEADRPSLRRAGGGLFDPEALTIRDAEGRVLVHVTPRAGVDAADHRTRAEELGLVVQATDERTGTLEGFLPLDAARQLAALPGTGTVAQALRPQLAVGAATSEGVGLQRVDRVHRAGVDGTGITVGALSNSFDVATSTLLGDTLTVRAADDVASGDLPGPGNRRNPGPVRVLAELPPASDQGTDEGRAMLQIVHDVAPGADLCFATGATGMLRFAQRIRELADPDGSCRADVLVDDLLYVDEPFFSDSPVSDAVDEVAAAGVHFFTPAGNAGLQRAWESPVRLLPAEKALAGTDLDFSGIEPALYDGGLQDLDPGEGTDVTQTIVLGSDGGTLDLQWDDPVDADGPTVGDPVLRDTGRVTAEAPEHVVTFTATPDLLGTTVLVRVDAVPAGASDLGVTVVAPDGSLVEQVYAGTAPEILPVDLAQAGGYTVVATWLGGAEGDVRIEVSPVVGPSAVTTDFNLLAFDLEGRFLGAVADPNLLTGRPSEIASIGDFSEIQVVVARAGTGPVGATRLRHVLLGDLHFAEHSDPLAPGIFGHPTARGATAVTSYDPFRPHLPGVLASPGGDVEIVFDSAGNRYRRPQTRRVPHVAATDGVNTTFFGGDSRRDDDALPNFNGTSASAPHAAAIAALVLDRSGGPGSVAPDELRERLQRSTFRHDLDPNHARGAARGLTVTADGAQGNEGTLVPGPMADPGFFSAVYTGRVPLRSITFYGETASPTAPGERLRPLSDGIVFDPRPFGGVAPFRDDGFPFTVGATSGGLDPASVTASFAVPAAPPAAPGQFRRMTLTFRDGLVRGQSVAFGVDRDLAVSGFGGADEGNGADELGGATLIPLGLALPTGLVFTAERTDGRTFAGALRNRIGTGWSPLDGYGLVDAGRAVLGR